MLALFAYWTAALLAVTALTYASAAAWRRRPLRMVPRAALPGVAHFSPRPLLVLCSPESNFENGEIYFVRQAGPGQVRIVPGPESVVIHRPAPGAQGLRGDPATLVAYGPGAEVWASAPIMRAVPHFETPTPGAVARLKRLDRYTWEATGFLQPPPRVTVDAARVDRAFVRYSLAIAAALAALGYYLEI